MLRTLSISAILLLLCAGSSPAEPLTLAEALSKRASVSETLKMARYDTEIAGDNVDIQRSGYLPRIDVQGGYTAQQAPQSISTPQGSVETQQADYGFISVYLSMKPSTTSAAPTPAPRRPRRPGTRLASTTGPRNRTFSSGRWFPISASSRNRNSSRPPMKK